MFNAPDDVGSGHVVLGADQKDGSARRAQNCTPVLPESPAGSMAYDPPIEKLRPPGSTRPRRGFYLIRARQYPDRHVAEDKTQHHDRTGAGEFDRRYVEGKDATDTDNRTQAKLIMVPNSKTFLPANFCRASRYAVSRPIDAVMRKWRQSIPWSRTVPGGTTLQAMLGKFNGEGGNAAEGKAVVEPQVCTKLPKMIIR